MGIAEARSDGVVLRPGPGLIYLDCWFPTCAMISTSHC